MSVRALAARAGVSRPLLYAGLVGLLIGSIGLFDVFAQGHRAFNTGSMDKMVWGLMVVVYAYLGLASFGVTIVTMLGALFRPRESAPLLGTHLLLGLSLALGALTALALELGHPLRAIWALPFNFQFRSPFYWMGVAWTVYLALLCPTLMLFRKVGQAVGRGLKISLLLAALGALTVQGLVYGLMAMRPVWFGSALPLYFLAAALLVGLALVVLFAPASHGSDISRLPPDTRSLLADTVPTALLAALIVYLLATASRIVTGLWSNLDGHRVVYEHLIRSGWFRLEIWLLLLPLALLAPQKLRRRPAVQVLASALLLVATFIGRYEFVIGGQQVPLFKGTWVPGLIDYAPSVTEWLLCLFAFSLSLIAYLLGSRLTNVTGGAGR